MPREVNKVIIHCTDSPTGRYVDVATIDKWHEARGFKPSTNGHACGYHYLILVDGTIQMGRMESDVGAHCKGQNHDSIGVCLVGRGEYNEDQIIALHFILHQICSGYGLEAKQVFGHYEFDQNGKTCPNMNMDKFRDELEITLTARSK